MRKPLYTSAARHDLVNILRYISRDNPGAAVEWVEKIESKCLLIAENPAIGELQPKFGDGVRSSIVGRYVIFHRQIAERVEILRVIAGDQDISQL